MPETWWNGELPARAPTFSTWLLLQHGSGTRIWFSPSTPVSRLSLQDRWRRLFVLLSSFVCEIASPAPVCPLCMCVCISASGTSLVLEKSLLIIAWWPSDPYRNNHPTVFPSTREGGTENWQLQGCEQKRDVCFCLPPSFRLTRSGCGIASHRLC